MTQLTQPKSAAGLYPKAGGVLHYRESNVRPLGSKARMAESPVLADIAIFDIPAGLNGLSGAALRW